MTAPTEDEDAYQREADAAALELAAAVLKRRFGVLTAGDLINGLASCTVLLRSGTGIIKPVPAADLERMLDEPWDGSGEERF